MAPRGTRRVLTAAGAALTALLLCAGCAGPGRTTLRILATASLDGSLDGCTCHYHPRAGLVKAAAWIRAERRGALLLDGGDLFAPASDPVLADEIAGAYHDLGYDAVAVGDQELAGDAAGLLHMASRVPLLAANLTLCPDGSPCAALPEGERIVRRSGWTVGIASVIDPATVPAGTLAARQVRIAPTQGAARETLARLQQRRVDLKVLLFHGGRTAAEELVRSVPGIDVVLFAHERKLVAPVTVAGSVLFSPGEGGNRIGILEIGRTADGIVVVRHGFHELSYATDPDDRSVRARVERYLEALRPPSGELR